MTADVQIHATGITKRFGGLTVLRDVDFSVHKGEVVVLMGVSGSGKTTLIRCLNLLEEPDAGSLDICGIAIECGAKKQSRDRRERVHQVRTQVGMVFQAFHLFPHKTALENVIEGPIVVKKMSRGEAVALGTDLLNQVGLGDKCDTYPSRLSGGQKQRVAIARALAMHPQVVLFDEPTSALDPELHEEVLRVMRKLAADGMTMVVVTHETGFARDVADRVLFLDDGQVVEEAPAKQFFERPEHPRARAFLRMVEHIGDGERHP
jgi:ABC-type polar amino acid transport system ATPase subunit